MTKIEWTDATWNPVRGCTKISPGCKHCYAETFAERWRGVHMHPYEQGFDLRLVPEKLEEPLRWKKPRRVFANSMSDLFQDGVPFEFIDKAFAVMALTPQHTYQILTKRPARMREYCSLEWRNQIVAHHTQTKRIVPWPLPNVWLGVSVEDQLRANERIPKLLETPAAVRFVSYEPALGPVGFLSWLATSHVWNAPLSWIIVGGESGPGSRLFNIEWARDTVRQCREADVACFVKQMGSVPVMPGCRQNHWDWGGAWGHEPKFSNYSENPSMWRIHLKSGKGGDPEEWPSDLRVREFPEKRHEG